MVWLIVIVDSLRVMLLSKLATIPHCTLQALKLLRKERESDAWPSIREREALDSAMAIGFCDGCLFLPSVEFFCNRDLTAFRTCTMNFVYAPLRGRGLGVERTTYDRKVRAVRAGTHDLMRLSAACASI